MEKESIRNNVETIRQRIGQSQLIGVLKGNGYGLGLIELAGELRENGVSFFGITEPEDAQRLREAGFKDENLLLLRSTCLKCEVEQILDADGTFTIGSYDAAVCINGVAKEEGVRAKAHIEIDTGMGRYGFMPQETDKVLSIYKFMDNIEVTGIYTHFCCAFSSKKKTLAQCDALMKVVDTVRENGYDPGIVHAENSAAVMKYDLTRYGFNAVRVGSAITGRVTGGVKTGLCRIGHLESSVIEIRWLPKGSSVGYGAAYRAKAPVKIAIVGVGYADGFFAERARDVYRFKDVVRYALSEAKRWLLNRNIYVTINGQRAKVLGHIGLAHTVLDISAIECRVGDTVCFDVSPVMVNRSIERKYL